MTNRSMRFVTRANYVPTTNTPRTINSFLWCLRSYPRRIPHRRPVPPHRRPEAHFLEHRLDFLIVVAVRRRIPTQQGRIPLLVDVEIGGELVRPDFRRNGNREDRQVRDRGRVVTPGSAACAGSVRRTAARAVAGAH